MKFEGGISKYAGLLDIALELGAVQKPSNGWYSTVDMETGEMDAKKYRAKDTDTDEFWKPLIKCPIFKQKIRDRFQVSAGSLIDTSSPVIEDEPDSED